MNVVVYEQLLKEHFAVERPPKGTVEVQLSKDELNALCYASGYVPMKLLKKGERERKKMGKIDRFEMCLGNMAVASEDTNFTQSTSEWFHLVNRGLFPINDETHFLFQLRKLHGYISPVNSVAQETTLSSNLWRILMYNFIGY